MKTKKYQAGGKVTTTKQKKSKEVASMSPSDVRRRASQIKINSSNLIVPGGIEPKSSRSFKDKEILKRDTDLVRRSTNSTTSSQNAKGTTTTVNRKGTPYGYKVQTKVVKSDGTTYYKEKKIPYTYNKPYTKTKKK